MERVLQRLPWPGAQARQPTTLRGLRVASWSAPRALPAAVRNVGRLRAAALPRTGAVSTTGAATLVLRQATSAARKVAVPPETYTHDLLCELARDNGWHDDKLSIGEQRILYETPLSDTKYEGTVRSKGQDDKKRNGILDAALFAAGEDLYDRDLLAVIELKAAASQLDEAQKDLDWYCEGLLKYKSDLQRLIGIAIAGNKDDGPGLKVFMYDKTINGGKPVLKYDKAINGGDYFPTPAWVDVLLGRAPKQIEYVQHQDLDGYAKKFNELFREAHVKDEKRPAVVGAIMLALWYAQKHKLSFRETPQEIITDVQDYCQKAFEEAEPRQMAMGKVLSSVLDSLKTKQRPGDVALASTKDKKGKGKDKGISFGEAVLKIFKDLKKLGVGNAQKSTDFLGQLYEHFFTYTGGNTIGQYFTPRWVTTLMAKMADVTLDDKVLDPCSGTGGFLIAAAQQALQRAKMEDVDFTWEKAIDKMKDNLYGFESESVTAALCVVNMIIRGDGQSKVYSGDCFKAPEFPTGAASVVLMNPPFGTKTPVHAFLDRGLEGLKTGGRLLAVVPDSVLFDNKSADWRKTLLQKHTLKAVIQLPKLTFQPFADVDTHIIMVEKGVPNVTRTNFMRMKDDAGLELSKKVVRPVTKDSNADAIDAVVDFLNDPHSSVQGVCAAVKVEQDSPDWSVGQHLPWHYPEEAELMKTANRLLLSWVSAKLVAEGLSSDAVASRLHTFDALAENEKNRSAREYLDAAANGTLGKAYLMTNGACSGMKHMKPGSQLLISASTYYNGVKGPYELSDVLHPPFITVTHKGSPGKAFVHTEPAAVLDTCLVLMPQADARPLENDAEEKRLVDMFLHAALITTNSWRFTYARACTHERIGGLELNKAQISDVNREKLVLKIKKSRSLRSMLQDMHESPL